MSEKQLSLIPVDDSEIPETGNGQLPEKEIEQVPIPVFPSTSKKKKTPLSRFQPAKRPVLKDVPDAELIWDDCENALRDMEENSIEALVVDPPAGISFMGLNFDKDKGGRDQWIAWLEGIMREVYRVLKPGAHGVVWALPRTSHWTATALENAGFEIRDKIMHHTGSGFPKGRNVVELDFLPEIERQLREQGIEGDIKWE